MKKELQLMTHIKSYIDRFGAKKPKVLLKISPDLSSLEMDDIARACFIISFDNLILFYLPEKI